MNIVYCFTFPNGKKYIGVTSNFNRRMTMHKQSAKSRTNDSLVHKALRKYKTVTVKILGRFEKFEDALNEEQKLIKELNTRETGYGYNLTNGGEGTLGCSPWNKGKVFKSETKEKISVSLGSKPIEVFKKDGTFVGSWINLNKCSTELKLYRGNITHCLKGKLNSTGGYIFKYKEASK